MKTTRGQHERAPVNDVQGMEVAKSTGDLSSIEACSGFQENPLSLEVVEQLGEEIGEWRNVSILQMSTNIKSNRKYLKNLYLATVDVVQHKVELVGGLEGVMKPHQERVLDVLQQDAALSHDMLLLERKKKGDNSTLDTEK